MRNALAQVVGRAHFAVHHKHLLGGVLHAAQPGDELVAVGMGRCRAELDHLGPHRHILAMDADGLFSICQPRTARAGGLVPGQDDHVAVVARMQGQVVQHTPARGHAAGCQDHAGAMQPCQAFGLLGRLHHGRAMLQRIHLAGIQAVLAQVVLVQTRGAHGHGAVQKHLERGRDDALCLEQANGMQHHLRPAHSKHGHHGHAPARGQACQRRAQLAEQVFGGVCAVAVGGFDQHRICAGRGIGRIHQHVVGPAQVAREQNAPPADLQQHTGRAQDVSGVREGGTPARQGLKAVVQRVRLELLEAVQRIQPRVQRQGGRVAAEVVAVQEGGVFLLQVSAVR